MDRFEIRSALENSELFKGLEKESLEKIVSLCRVETYRPGEYVFRQGDFGEFIYIIVEGHVSLERSIDLGSRKGKAVIGMLGKGRAFGCWSTLLSASHSIMSSACCQKSTKLVVMNGTDLREMMLSNTELGFSLLEKICFLLRERIQGAYGAMERI